jgi:hypothetical protein
VGNQIATPTPTEIPTTGIVHCVDGVGAATNVAVCINATGYTTIQAAVDVASDGDEIRIVNRTYTGSGLSVVGVDKALYITGGFSGGTSGWTISTSSTGTVIDGQGSRDAMTFTGTSTLTLQNLTLKNGGTSASGGGVIRVQTGTVNFTNGGTLTGLFSAASGAAFQFTSGSESLSDDTAFVGEGLVRVAGATLNVEGTSSVQNFELTSGSLTGAGNLTVTETMMWSGGTMTGTGSTAIAAGATLALSGNAAKQLGTRVLSNAGTVTWTGAGTLLLSSGAVINNLAGALFEVQNDTSIAYYSGERPTFTNAGTFRKTVGTGTTTIVSAVTFNNSGTVEVLSGTLAIAAGGSSSGVFTVAAGSAVTFTGSYTLDNGSNLLGAGVARVSTGTLTVSGSVSVQNFELTSGSLTGAGTLTVTGTMTWSGGTMSGTGSTAIAAGATLALSGNAAKQLGTRVLSNAGAATWTGTGTLQLSSGAVITNLAGALFEVQNDSSVAYYCCGAVPPTFTNAGIFRKTTATGTTSIASTVAFNNSGAVDIESGIVRVSGNYAPAPSAALNVTLGGLTVGTQFGQLAVGSGATLAGALNVSLAPGYMPDAGDSFRIVTAGTRTGTFSSASGLDFGGGRYLTVNYDPTGVNLVMVEPTLPPALSAAVGPGTSDTPPPSATPAVTVTVTVTATPTATATPSPTPTPTQWQ